MTITQVLAGHVSADTAFLVKDYPYGFRLRCQIRYWIETKAGHGQRVVSQTTNPKKPGTVWNKPKASTYSDVRVLFLDEQGYVQNAALNLYTETAKIEEFEKDFAAALTSDRDQLRIKTLKTANTLLEARRAAREATAVPDPSWDRLVEVISTSEPLKS